MDLGMHYANEVLASAARMCVFVSMHVSSSFHQLCSVLPDIENLHLKLCVCINEYLQAHTPCVCVCVWTLYLQLWICVCV